MFEAITRKARKMGLNVIHDVTLKGTSALKNVASFKKKGYRIEGHYMVLPRQDAAARAISRYLGKGPGKSRSIGVRSPILHSQPLKRYFFSSVLHPYSLG